MRRLSLSLATIGFALTLAGPALATANKVSIIHKPGTPAEKCITVSENALQAHLDHGDRQTKACRKKAKRK